MICPRCEHDSQPRAKFCSDCGHQLLLVCLKCRETLPPEAHFCPECGQPRGSGATPAEPLAPRDSDRDPAGIEERSAGVLDGERKQVTVLFCDLTNSTRLAEGLGAEAMHGFLNRFFELALGEVRRYEGTINQFLGDGFMALFGAPVAHEEHARRAAMAALGIRKSFRQRRAELVGSDAGDLELRMGINTGLVVVGNIGDDLRMDYTAVGDTTNVAARLQQVAEPGQILMSEATARLIGGEVRVAMVGPLAVKGKSDPISAYAVLGRTPRRFSLDRVRERVLTPFVGRVRELSTLHDLFALATRGRGQVVGLIGEPGIGKSRLLYEFWQGVRTQDVTYVDWRCRSYGSALPYLPIRDVVRDDAGITDNDSAPTIVDKVRHAVQDVGLEPDQVAPSLLHLLGVTEGTGPLDTADPEALKAGIVEHLRQLLLRRSRQRPLVVLVEDLHWIDTRSDECLASLADSVGRVPILLTATYRPGYQPRWMDKSYATQLALPPLSRADSRRIMQAVLPRASLADAVTDAILEKSDGNPLYLEELGRGVRTHGDLDVGGVPHTLQAVLMARIDRLAEVPKRLLQTASVLGRDFSARLLEAVWEGQGLDAALDELKQLEFLYPDMEADDPLYVFNHSFIQEAAYSTLLAPLRQGLHEVAARALEKMYDGRLDEIYDRLVYHYSRSEKAEVAEHYVRLAARK